MGTNKGSSLLAFLLGGAVGAGIALLYAPASGAETRKRIREGADGAGDRAKDLYQDAKDKVTDSTGRVAQMVNDRKEDLHAAIDAGKEAYYKGKERLTRETGS
ncbi:MAG: YtxH domain-containing protein [Deltaproteobacteria bacterium]|nr:YtxH domain-containing protein [Deltaproteobacteria bacterium]